MRCIVRTRTDKGAMYVKRAPLGRHRPEFTPYIQESELYRDLSVAQRVRDSVLERWRKADILRVGDLKNMVRKMEVTKNVEG